MQPVELTLIQAAIWKCLSRGLSNKQIAEELKLNPARVALQLRKLLRALGARSRYEAAVFYIRSEKKLP